MHKRGADTFLGQPLVGPRPAPPDGRVRRPRDDHRAAAAARTIRCSSSRRSCPGSGSRRSCRTPTSSVVSQERLIKQIAFPKIVLPVVGRDRGRRGLRVRAHPARADHAVLPAPHLALPAVHPAHRRGPVRLQPRRRRFLVAAGNVFFRDLGNVCGTSCACGGILSPGLYSLAVLDELSHLPRQPDPAS